MVTFFWCPRTRAARVMWMLEELGIEYERRLIDVRDAKAKSAAAFCSASPMGKVPAIIDGEVKIADSATICLYLADKYALGRLAPHLDDSRRGQYLYWMLYVPGVVEPAMVEKFAGAETSRFTRGWGDYDLMVEVLEIGLEQGPWLLGDDFSAADVMVGSTVNFLKIFGIMPQSKVLEGYLQRCLAREAYRKTLHFDKQEAEKMKS